MVLFPTGGGKNEQGCFPIRVGSILNAERVIVTDDSDTEFHNTLRQYNCMVTGKDTDEIAQNVVRFFSKGRYREQLERNVRKAKEELRWENFKEGLVEYIGGK